MTYESFCKNKDYAMKYVVPAFRKFGVSKLKVKDDGSLIYNHHGQPERELNSFQKYANAIAYCGTKKNFKVCADHDCHTTHFDGFESCKNRFCPVCQKMKSLILFSKLYPTVMKLFRHGCYVKMLTFTIKDTENLKDGVRLIKTAFRKFSHENKKYRTVFNNLYIGGIKSLEVKRGANSKMWHPHYHALVVMEKPVEDFNAINVMWNKTLVNIVNNSHKAIYEDRLYNDGFTLTEDNKLVLNDKLGFVHFDTLNLMSLDSRIHCIYECIKYITKYSEELEEDLPELVDTLRGIRAIDSWGVLRDIEKDAEECDTLSLSSVKEHICVNCGKKEFEIIDHITIEDLGKLGYSTKVYDFNTKQNKLERQYEGKEKYWWTLKIGF